jgi:hypothetical protein
MWQAAENNICSLCNFFGLQVFKGQFKPSDQTWMHARDRCIPLLSACHRDDFDVGVPEEMFYRFKRRISCGAEDSNFNHVNTAQKGTVVRKYKVACARSY